MFEFLSVTAGVVLIVCTFAASILTTMLGLGGGVIYIPLQVFLGIEYHQAAATSLFLVILNSISASAIYSRANLIDWKLVAVIELATVLGGFIGGFSSGYLSPSVLAGVFCVIVTSSGVIMLRVHSPNISISTAGRGRWQRNWREYRYAVPLLIVLPLALGIGLVSNLAGIGGGVLLVPLLTIIGGVPMQVAIGSSVCMVGITAFSGFLGHLVAGHFRLDTALALGIAVIIGSQIGARISTSLEKHVLKQIFAWSSICIGLLMFLRGIVA